MPRSWGTACQGLAALLAVSALSALPSTARARSRPRFEPTDLEWEETGTLEVDVEVGAVRSAGPWRVMVADFEMDVGLLPNLELGLDGAIAIEGPASGPFSLDHTLYDVLWPALKIGLYDDVDELSQRTFATGLQIGPKLPVRTTIGVGAEGLLIAGVRARPLTFAVNVGGFLDPAPDAASTRPWGGEAGIDLELVMGKNDRFTLTGELGGALFGAAAYSHQLHATAGLSWSATPTFDVSIVGIFGFLAGDDRYGMLVGIEPKFRLFQQ